MQVTDWIGMLGGLALFLYGMEMMSEGLESLAENRLEKILRQLTNHKVKAVLVGMLVTALIQSSSAMTVMLVGFVNSGIMPLENAIWVVMGANIGTTITGQMLALDIGLFAPLIAFIGVMILVSLSRMRAIGASIGGIGFLFMGLEIMSISLTPLNHSALFLQVLQYVSHPLLGIIVGTIVTAIIQSSSASIGILQTLAKNGLITLEQATYVIFGFDIGTCVTALLASLTGSRTGKQLALFHIILNVFGTIVFTFISLLTPFIEWVHMLTPHLVMTQLANMHSLFNLGTTLLTLGLDQYFLKIIYHILPSKE